MQYPHDIELKVPHNLEAEQAVLGSILKNPNAFDDVCELVSIDDFLNLITRQYFLRLARWRWTTSPSTLSRSWITWVATETWPT